MVFTYAGLYNGIGDVTVDLVISRAMLTQVRSMVNIVKMHNSKSGWNANDVSNLANILEKCDTNIIQPKMTGCKN